MKVLNILFVSFLTIFNTCFVFGQICNDTIKYKWEGKNHEPIIFYGITILTFCPDSTYIREDFILPSKNVSFDSIIPEKEVGKWKVDKNKIIVNYDKGIDNAYYAEYKLKRNSIRWITNPNYLKTGKLRYNWLLLTKPMKLKKIE